eukprot:8454096-Pyramimonas_sp.AAC.1
MGVQGPCILIAHPYCTGWLYLQARPESPEDFERAPRLSVRSSSAPAERARAASATRDAGGRGADAAPTPPWERLEEKRGGGGGGAAAAGEDAGQQREG